MSDSSEVDQYLSKARKYGGVFSAVATFTNLALGSFLAYAFFGASDHTCNSSLPVWMAVSSVTSIIYGGETFVVCVCVVFFFFFFFFLHHCHGWTITTVAANPAFFRSGLFLLYTIYALVTFIRHSGYQEIESSSTLAEAARPGCFFCCTGVVLLLVYLFRFAWLIFGTGKARKKF